LPLAKFYMAIKHSTIRAIEGDFMMDCLEVSLPIGPRFFDPVIDLLSFF
jgi:hypothetical protein